MSRKSEDAEGVAERAFAKFVGDVAHAAITVQMRCHG
jgi:hypothetical protein